MEEAVVMSGVTSKMVKLSAIPFAVAIAPYLLLSSMSLEVYAGPNEDLLEAVEKNDLEGAKAALKKVQIQTQYPLEVKRH